MQAICRIKPLPHYRRDSFVAGLEANGLTVVARIARPGPGDVLCLWNLTGSTGTEAAAFERAGAKVIVAENAYLAPWRVQMYALSLHDHGGAGRFPVGEGDRWAALGIEIEPWRTGNEDGHVLVCGQRGIGSAVMASPHGWHIKVAEKLQRATKRRVQVRHHPNSRAVVPLAKDLAGAWVCVTWASTVGVHALVAGVPVLYCAPHWICSGAAHHGLELLEEPLRDDALRLHALQRMAWGQWTPDEIASGAPVRGVLAC